jgi:hypothetical protein
MRNNFNFPNRNTPWYLSDSFFSVFFGAVTISILAIFLAQGFALYQVVNYALKQDLSKGVIPAVEKVLCGEPKCLKGYFQ